jgi:hypothetical protein
LGLRKNEILRLRIEDVDLSARIIRIVPRAGNRLKTVGSAQPVPIPEAIVELIRAWIEELGRNVARDLDSENPNPRIKPWLANNRPVDPGLLLPNAWRTMSWTGGSEGYTPLDKLRALGKRAGVEGLSFQSLRHSWASHAESLWGFSPAQIMRILRHANLNTQLGYRHPDVHNLAAMVENIGFSESGHAEPAPPVDPEPRRRSKTRKAEHVTTAAETPGPDPLGLALAIAVTRAPAPAAPVNGHAMNGRGTTPAQAAASDADLFGSVITFGSGPAVVAKPKPPRRLGRPPRKGTRT